MVIQINRKRDSGGGCAVAAHLDFDFTKNGAAFDLRKRK
jgi:hypothetical protein